jgi:hypothetical protein
MSGTDKDSAQSQSNISYFFGSLMRCQHLSSPKARTKDSRKPLEFDGLCHVMSNRTCEAV